MAVLRDLFIAKGSLHWLHSFKSLQIFRGKGPGENYIKQTVQNTIFSRRPCDFRDGTGDLQPHFWLHRLGPWQRQSFSEGSPCTRHPSELPARVLTGPSRWPRRTRWPSCDPGEDPKPSAWRASAARKHLRQKNHQLDSGREQVPGKGGFLHDWVPVNLPPHGRLRVRQQGVPAEGKRRISLLPRPWAFRLGAGLRLWKIHVSKPPGSSLPES